MQGELPALARSQNQSYTSEVRVMGKKALSLDLSTIDGQRLDGLEFCRGIYDLFDKVRASLDGVARLRLRPTITEKRLIEELIPIARYIQSRYCEGRRIEVRWFSGSQPYDAILWSSGGLVEHGMAPKEVLLEVTTAVHPNEHLVRRLLHERGGSFGVKGTFRDKKTGAIVSKPHVHTNNELVMDLAAQVIERLKGKSKKAYPPNTVMLINCTTNGLILPSEWEDAVELVRKAKVHSRFLEVFLLELTMSHSATLYGERSKEPGD